MKYDHRAIEKKWQERWTAQWSDLFGADDNSSKPKYYLLVEFPYPSGEGLHMGHPRSYTALDIIARKRRMEGYNVLYPIGWDAFGLPAENYAIKTGQHPRITTQKNIATFRRQLQSLGISFDWSREVDTTDPKYYRWTQWIFLQFYKYSLAYKARIPINWCPKDKIGLANEEVISGNCERCGTPVEKRDKEQWMLAITKYADRLIDDLATVDFWEKIKHQQIDWIGRSEGAEIDFDLNLPPLTGEVAFASNNQGKLKRMQKLVAEAGLDITLKTPKDLGIENFDVVEDGKTIVENAEKKARALAEKINLPVLADDSGFFIEGAEVDPVTVKRNALAGLDEKLLSIDEIGEKMQNYYRDLAKTKGGSVEAEWRNALCLMTPEKVASQIETIRPVTLTDKPHGKADPYLPLRALYISKATGKYVLEQTEEEELIELRPITTGLKKLFIPSITVFTTRPDTLFGATYLVLAPEHPFVNSAVQQKLFKNKGEVGKYIEVAKKKSEIDRTSEGKEKTGVELKGILAVNPINQKEIPIFVADYVLGNYGTGAIMAVPAHDERDFEFAKKYGLEIKYVIAPPHDISEAKHQADHHLKCYTGPGNLVNSEEFNELTSESGTQKIIDVLEVAGKAQRKINYHLRDWVFSRQRYWGEPIPIVQCESCGLVPVPEDQLPVELPEVEKYQPTDNGESPLATISDWVNTKCPKCGSEAKRETDVMPNWAGSSWYFMRYCDPRNDKQFASSEKLKYWMPIDWYNGGMEHTTLHLLYSRFWNKFLFDLGLAPTFEPYAKRTSHGLILAEDGEKMSKSRGNVINPDTVVEEFGADSLRCYEMFIGPFDQPVPWNKQGVIGVRRFLEKVAEIKCDRDRDSDRELSRIVHKTIKKVTEDIEALKFNTAISQMMICTNSLVEAKLVSQSLFELFLKTLSPFAPHLAEELWSSLGHATSIIKESWPLYDPELVKDSEIELVVQVNGKVRDRITVPIDLSEDELKAKALNSEKVHPLIEGKQIKRVIVIQGKLVNIVIE